MELSWYKNGIINQCQLIKEFSQKSCSRCGGSLIFRISGVEVGRKNRITIDQKMKSKIRCMLASIFERFGLLFGAKLAWKIHQKVVPKGVEKKMPKRRDLNGHRNSKKSHLRVSWERLD